MKTTHAQRIGPKMREAVEYVRNHDYVDATVRSAAGHALDPA
jgi:hypothetical protein